MGMMSVEQMKKAVQDAYPGKKWRDKVSRMGSGQIIALYYKFLDSKKLG
jgi:hypothetical protein